MVLKRGPLQWG